MVQLVGSLAISYALVFIRWRHYIPHTSALTLQRLYVVNTIDIMDDLPDKKLVAFIGLTFISGVALGLLLEKYGFIDCCTRCCHGGSDCCRTGKKN